MYSGVDVNMDDVCEAAVRVRAGVELMNCIALDEIPIHCERSCLGNLCPMGRGAPGGFSG